MNRTVVRLTLRGLLGRRRLVFVLLLPAVLLLLAIGIRSATGADPEAAEILLGSFALGALVPLLGLIAGTGVLAPEIDDGSIVYLLAKPVSRSQITRSKLLVATGTVAAFGALPTLVAGVILTGSLDRLAVGYAVGGLIAGIAYCALFLMLSVLTRHAVIVGLLYALLWEAAIGVYVPGAQTLSVQQWSLAVTGEIAGPTIESAVSLPTGVVLLVVVFAASTWYAGHRLRSLTLRTDE
jgi:ABC-2 type transport system permease protein